MRIYLWSGTVAVLLVGTGIFMAARYAAGHPHSFAGRCAMTIYHMWEPLFAPPEDDPPAAAIVHAGDKKAPVIAHAQPAAEPIEPIVIEPTDQEPPLAVPSLSPEIAAALERLRAEEESEAPPKAFGSPSRTLRMPYADEEMDLPIVLGVARALGASNPCGCFWAPACCQEILRDIHPDRD